MSSNRDRKVESVRELTDHISSAKALVVTDYTGLTVSQIGDLRSQVKKAGGDYTVTKNTLLKLALKGSGSLPESLEAVLAGPTALLIASSDEIAPLKALTAFAKTANIPTIKAGLLGDRVLTPDEVNRLAALPAKEILIGKLLGLLNAPITNLAYVLNGNTTKLVRVLSEIAKTKQS